MIRIMMFVVFLVLFFGLQYAMYYFLLQMPESNLPETEVEEDDEFWKGVESGHVFGYDEEF